MKYHLNQMSNEELIEFKSQLKNDSQLNSEFNDFTTSQHLVLDARLTSVKSKLNNMVKSNNAPVPSNRLVNSFLIGGGIMIILLTFLFYPNPSEKFVDSKTSVVVIDEVISKEDLVNQKAPTTNNETKETTARKVDTQKTKAEVVISDINETTSIHNKTEINNIEGIQTSEEILEPEEIADLDVDEIIYKPELVETKTTNDLKTIEEKSVEDICLGRKIKIKSSTKTTCSDKNEGAIILEELKGGNAPYSISISEEIDDKKYKRLNKNNYTKYFLQSGTYYVSVIDADGCAETTSKIEIPSKDCKDYSGKIVRSAGQFWKVPAGYSGKLKIISLNSGNLIYQLNVESGINYEWQGTENNGSELPIGEYYFTFETNTNETFVGYISIIN